MWWGSRPFTWVRVWAGSFSGEARASMKKKTPAAGEGWSKTRNCQRLFRAYGFLECLVPLGIRREPEEGGA